MEIDQYIVDAFASEVFEGNQAAVCITRNVLSDELMQKIAIENNLSETAFLVPLDSQSEELHYSLRWFTPGGEIDLCGHATLASAFVVDRFLSDSASLKKSDMGSDEDRPCSRILFDTMSGLLSVMVEDSCVSMEMPAYSPHPICVTDDMAKAFGAKPTEAWLARDLICVFPDEETVRRMQPNTDALQQLDGLLQVATASFDSSDEFDCISRCFAPKLGVYEDPVTGSSHCAIAPIWSKKLGKNTINAFQASFRTGSMRCFIKDHESGSDKIEISGSAVLYAQSRIQAPNTGSTLG